MNEQDLILTIADEIKRYLAERPQAADNINGITNWWLLRQRLSEHRVNVSKALQLLVAQGFVRQETRSDGEEIFFSLAPITKFKVNKNN